MRRNKTVVADGGRVFRRAAPVLTGPGRRGLYTYWKNVGGTKQDYKPGYRKPNIAGSTHDFRAMRITPKKGT